MDETLLRYWIEHPTLLLEEAEAKLADRMVTGWPIKGGEASPIGRQRTPGIVRQKRRDDRLRTD